MATLQDVIVGLKQQGELNRKAIEESTSALIDAFTDTIEVFGQQMAMPGALLPIQEEEPDGIPGTDGDSKEEEDKREERKIFQRLIDTMEGVGKAMESLSDSILDTVGKAGKAAGIATLLALFIKPEIAMKVIEKAINVFNDGLTAIGDLMMNSTEGLTNFIQNHPIVTGVGTTLVVVKLVGVIGSLIDSAADLLRKFKGIFRNIVSIGKGILSFGKLIISGIVKISALFAKVLGILSSITGIAIGPLIAAIAGIGLAIYGLFNGFTEALKTFEETGSVVEAFKSFWSNFLGSILNVFKSLLSTIVGFLGFEEVEAALDELDFVVLFQELFNWISEIPSKILDYIKNAASKIPIIGGLFSNDEEEDSSTEKKLTVTTKEGETKQLTQDELVEAVSKGEVSKEVAKTAIQDSKKYAVTTKEGKTKQLTQSELVESVSRGEVSTEAAKTAISRGEVSTEAAKTAIQDSKERKYAVTTKEGKTEYLTRDDLIKRRRSNGMRIDTANRVFAADPYTAREGEVLSQEQMNSLFSDNVSETDTNVSKMDTNTTDRVFATDPYTAREGEVLSQEQMNSLFSDNESSNVVSLSDVRAKSSSDTDRVVSIGNNVSNDMAAMSNNVSDRVFSNNVSDRVFSNNVSDRVFSNNVSSDKLRSSENLTDKNRVTLKENAKSSESFFGQIGKSVSNMISTGLQSIPIIGDLFKASSTADTSIANTSGLSSSSNVISMKDYKASVANGDNNVNLSRNFASNPYTAREGEYLSQEQMNSILGGSESNQMEISSVESPITSLYKTTQAENTALSSQSSSTAEQTVAAIAPMIAALGVGGGSSNRTNNNISNTSVTNNFSPDTLSREFIYRPA